MYTSLTELIRGWRKNIFAGSAESLPPLRIARVLHPFFLFLPPLMMLAPVVALVWGILASLTPLVLFGTIATAASLLWWAFVYHSIDVPIRYALAFPVGAAVLLYIIVTAFARGRRVTWKGREYVSG
jgi:hypothetical protein